MAGTLALAPAEKGDLGLAVRIPSAIAFGPKLNDVNFKPFVPMFGPLMLAGMRFFALRTMLNQAKPK